MGRRRFDPEPHAGEITVARPTAAGALPR